MPDLDLEQAERLAAEFWTEPGDQQTARTALVALVGRVRALTAAGDALAAVADPLLSDEVGHFMSAWEIDPHHGLDGEKLADSLRAALAAWRALVGGPATVTRNDHGDVLLYHGGPFNGRPFSPLDPPTEHDESYVVRLSDGGMILGAWWDPPVNPPPYGAAVTDG